MSMVHEFVALYISVDLELLSQNLHFLETLSYVLQLELVAGQVQLLLLDLPSEKYSNEAAQQQRKQIQ